MMEAVHTSEMSVCSMRLHSTISQKAIVFQTKLVYMDIVYVKALMMEAVHTSVMSVYFNETTHHYIPEGYCLPN
jgi:hypothetical protein